MFFFSLLFIIIFYYFFLIFSFSFLFLPLLAQAHAFAKWTSISAGRLERIRCALLIQSVFRGYQCWSRWPKELDAYKWATGIVQAAWRGRVGRRIWRKENRHEMLELYKQIEAECERMQIEDEWARNIMTVNKAASMVQRQWRGLQGRDLAFIARNKRKKLQAMQFKIDQQKALRLAEEKQAQREEEAMLRWLASMRVQSWWRGCLGKKAFRDAKHLVLMTKKAILIQSNFRAMKARRFSAAKRRIKYDIKQSLEWRAQQGLAMRYLKFRQRRTQRQAYRFMEPLGLKPITYNFSTAENYGLRYEYFLVNFFLFLFEI